MSPPSQDFPPPKPPTRPTMEDVASRAGVSRSLVSLVMRDSPKVSDKSRIAVEKAAAELGYRTNFIASNLASNRTRTIGVVLNDLHNPYFAEIHDGMVGAAEDVDYHLIMNGGRGKAEIEAAAIASFLSYRVEGIIVVGAQIDDERLDELVSPSRTPVVVVGRHAEGDLIDCVHINDVAGTHLAIDHLVGLGHRRIAHIDGGTGAGATVRSRAYQDAMVAAGLDHEIRIATGDFTEAGGYAGAQQLMTDGTAPSAIFAANDLSAIGALDWLLAHDRTIPDDVSVVGFDNTALSALRHLSLTTIDQPRQEMGARAFAVLIDRIEGRDQPIRHIVEPRLVVRRSTAAPTAGAEPSPKEAQ